MMTVVLDTNVLVAASRSRRGASSKLLRSLTDGRFRIAVSVPLVLEYEAVLLRDQGSASWNADDVLETIDWLCDIALRQVVSYRLRPLPGDADDAFILELAFAASVDCVVTHNIRHLVESGKPYGIEVITPARFLRRLESSS